MTAFDEDEQLYSDLDWYAIDRDGNIGQFSTAGHRLLPVSFASNKEMTEKLSNYFESLSFGERDFFICPSLKNNSLALKNMFNLSFEAKQMSDISKHFGKRMASRGLFSYDSNTMWNPKYKSYFRFAIPKQELKIDHLPHEIKAILENFRLSQISFAEADLISDEITDNL